VSDEEQNCQRRLKLKFRVGGGASNVAQDYVDGIALPSLLMGYMGYIPFVGEREMSDIK
jgi:hypothetical protein